MKRYGALISIIAMVLILAGCSKNTDKLSSHEKLPVLEENSIEENEKDASATIADGQPLVKDISNIDEGVKDKRFSNNMNDKGETSIIIKDVNLIDYVIEDNYAYLLVVDTTKDDMECVKYNIHTEKTTILYKTIKPIFVNVYSHFLKKKKDSYLMVDLRDTIIMIDTHKNTVEKEIIFPEDTLYGDINYEGNQLCYYKKGNLYLANTDFSSETLLKEDVGDTEDTVQPCWSHDDQKIAYFNDYQVEVIDTHGKVHESLPRAARYVKWTQDDTSLLIGTNGGGTKIDLKNKVVYTTHGVDYAYAEQGFRINYLDSLSNEVIYSGVNNLLAYKMRSSNAPEACDAIGVFDGKNQYMMKEARLPKLIRWKSSSNEVAILYDEKEYQELCILDVHNDKFEIRSSLHCEPLKENYYINDNKVIKDDGEWIIISEGRQGVVRVNLDTGEQFIMDPDANTITQPLKKWNYIWNYMGIYLTSYNGEGYHIVSSEKYFDSFYPIDNGLVFRCGNSIYLYDYVTMETTKLIFGNDYSMTQAYSYKEGIYLNISSMDENKLVVYHRGTGQLEDIYQTMENISCKGLVNNTLYFNDKKLDCLTNKVLDSHIPLSENSKLVSWSNKIYIQNGAMLAGYSHDELKTVHYYNINNSEYNGDIWYYGEKMYVINRWNNRIYRVNATKYKVEQDYPIHPIHDNAMVSQEDKGKVYLVGDKVIVKSDDSCYEMQMIDGDTDIKEYTGSTDFSEDVLYLNSQNKFQSKKHDQEIESIIGEPFKVYDDNDNYIVYVSNDKKLKVINRNTKDITLISPENTGDIYLQGHYVYYDSHGTGIFQYNILTDVTKQLLEGSIHKYIISGNRLYYIQNYLDRSLHMLDLDSKVSKQLTQDSVYVKDILIVDNALYYVVINKAPILYKMDHDQSVFIGLFNLEYFDRVFAVSHDKIGYIQYNSACDFIVDMTTTDAGQINDILYEYNNMSIFNSYAGGYESENYVLGYYDKNNNSLIKMENSYYISEIRAYNDVLYLIGEHYDNYFIDKIDLKTMNKNNELKKQCNDFAISDGEYVAYKPIIGKDYILYNIKTKESRTLSFDIDFIDKFEGEYIYYTHNDKKYRCHVNDLMNCEEID